MALEEARKRKLLTVALLGYDGGEIRRRALADFPLVVQCDYIPRIQEVQSVYLPHHPRYVGGAKPWPSLNFLAQRGARILRKCASGWNGSAAISLSTTSRPTPLPVGRMRELAAGQRGVPVLVEDGKVVQIGWQGRSCFVDVE